MKFQGFISRSITTMCHNFWFVCFKANMSKLKTFWNLHMKLREYDFIGKLTSEFRNYWDLIGFSITKVKINIIRKQKPEQVSLVVQEGYFHWK